MREMIRKANAGNPEHRKVHGFQAVFSPDENALETVVSGAGAADEFDLVYCQNGIEIYRYLDLLQEGGIQFYDCKFIAAKSDQQRALVIQGLIAVNRRSQLKAMEKHAKKELIKAIKKTWKVNLMKSA